jgi:RHS repeat-associated protein
MKNKYCNNKMSSMKFVLILIAFPIFLSIDVYSQCMTPKTITGGGNLCNGTRTVTINLIPSTQANAIYELKRDGVDSGYPPITGTGGGPVSWTITSGVGTYTVIGKIGTCTLQMGGSPVVYNQQVPVPTISATGTGCSTTLTGNGGTSYSWRWNSATGAVIATTQSIQPKKGGTYYLTAINDCGNSAQTAYNLTSIANITLTPNGSPANTCPGVLTLIGGGGTSYQWTFPNGTTSANTSIVVNIAGTYTLTGTNTCGIQETLTVPVTMYPVLTSPTVSNVPITIKEGTSKIINNTIVSGAGANESYQWYNSAGTFLANGLTFTTPTLSATTTYKVSKYSTNGTKCVSASVPVVVTVNKKPIVNAGPDQSLTYPLISTNLNGTVTDAENDPLTYGWGKITGGNFTSTNLNLLSVSLSDLDVITYTYRLTASDGFNDSVFDDVNINVTYPPNNYNYVKETIVLKKNCYTENDISNLIISNGDKSVSYTYKDGLGRDMQSVSVQGSPLGMDLVVPKVYDEFGRESKNYLPVVVSESNGFYKPNNNIIDTNTGNYKGIAANCYAIGSANEIADDTRPFAQTTFELSPLNRIDKMYGPGSDWFVNGKFSQTQLITNVHGTGSSLIDEKVIVWKLSSGMPIRDLNLNGGYYPTGALYIKSITDDNGLITRSYLDKDGRIILKKVQAVSSVSSLNDNKQWASTYYIHDDLGNVMFVLQPELSKTLLVNDTSNPSSTQLKAFAFQYKYDERQRMVEKNLPGADTIRLIYDKLNRLVLTQDGNQKPRNEWTYYKYDAFSRPIIKGLYTHTAYANRVKMLSNISATNFFETYDGTNLNHGYSNVVFPTANTKALTVTYYDNYKFRDNLAGSSYNYFPNDIDGQDSPNASVIGQVTGVKLNILETTNYLWSVTYYDQNYRTIQTITQNHKNGIDRVTNIYDFVKIKETITVHNNGSATYKTDRKFDYDHSCRLVNTWHKFNTAADFVLLQSIKYNEIGQKIVSKQHSRDNGITFAQNTNYEYNVRGWLKKINDPTSPEASDLFSMELKYNDSGSNGGNKQYNGNVSESIWKTVGTDNQSYGYSYDAMNRLVQSQYYDTVKPVNNGNFTEKITAVGSLNPYDMNGNINHLVRYGKQTSGFGTIDDLTYSNNGNQVTQIEDGTLDVDDPTGFSNKTTTANEYTYDQNGNLTKDSNKGLSSVTYNYLNLVSKASRSVSDYVTYTYDALGNKLSQQVFGSITKATDYIGDFVYENGSLVLVNNEQGRIVPDNSVSAPRPWQYQYFLKDHLGNIRVTFSEYSTSVPCLATMETDPSSIETDEASKFQNLKHANKMQLYYHGGQNSYRLSGCPGEVVGPAKDFEVKAGEIYDVEVYARYETPTSEGSDVGNFLTSVIGAFALHPTGLGIDGAQAYNKFTSLFTGTTWVSPSKTDDDLAPKAYVNYLLFDLNFNLVDFGFHQVTTTAATTWDYLSVGVKVKQTGYLYVYLSNENNTIANVYFDDFKITKYTNVVQSNDYYPFGLTFNSYLSTENTVPQNNLYNSKELQDELDLRWLDYGARMYMPDIARWNGIDPLAEKYLDASPYSYGGNSPLVFRDPNGRELWFSITYLDADYNEVTERLRYKDGKLYNEDGSLYKGTSAADPIFQLVRQQINALKQIIGNNPEINRLFSYLESKSSGNHTIKIDLTAKENRFDYFWKKGLFQTTYNPFIDEDPEHPGRPYTPVIGLLHELQHSYDYSTGVYQFEDAWRDANTFEIVNYDNYEARAMNTENVLRLALYGTIRKTYDMRDKKTRKWRTIYPPSKYLTNQPEDKTGTWDAYK